MVGLKSRFDNDSETDTSDLRQWTTQLQYEKENEPASCVIEGEIEFVDNRDDSLLLFLTRTEDIEVSNTASINPEKSMNTKETQIKRKIDAVDSVNKEKIQRGTDAKFIFKNKRSKPSEITQDMHLKNEILVLQKQLLLQEIKGKSDIAELTLENLKLDTQIKRLTLQKLEANVIDIHYNK